MKWCNTTQALHNCLVSRPCWPNESWRVGCLRDVLHISLSSSALFCFSSLSFRCAKTSPSCILLSRIDSSNMTQGKRMELYISLESSIRVGKIHICPSYPSLFISYHFNYFRNLENGRLHFENCILLGNINYGRIHRIASLFRESSRGSFQHMMGSCGRSIA